jgi:phosphopantothenoylcysteine decarboxylase / phosphopantothenate---cysteine ligase
MKTSETLAGKRVLLVIAGGIAAYKALEAIRRLRERGARVRVILTQAAEAFVTPLTVGALSNERVFTTLFDLDDEHEIGHIRLARDTDIVVVAPATAHLIARMAQGLADDLATTCLLATHAPILLAPAMNPAMWSHPATKRNVARLIGDGVHIVGPAAGEMAERGEAGVGRLVEPLDLVAAVEALLTPAPGPLTGVSVVVTSGPTHEPIDPVRYIANRSSGRQGHAVAGALARLGARVTLVSGPVTIADPKGCSIVKVETAREMLAAVEAALPAEIAVMAAAVADWRVDGEADHKIKKAPGAAAPALSLVENPDILATLGRHATLRPRLVVGFAAETRDLIDNARGKLARKGADLIVANDVSPETGVMGGTTNTVRLVSHDGVEDWPLMDKDAVADKLAARIAALYQAKRP